MCGAGRAFASCPPDSGRVVTGGIKAEANAFAYLMTGVSPQVAKTTPGAGVSIGGFVFFDIHKHLALQIDIFYHFKQAHTEQHGIKANLRYLSVELPFYVVGQWRFKDCSRLFVGTGPDVDFGYYAVLESKGEKFDLYKKDDDTELSAMQNNSMGWAIMAGYEFADNCPFRNVYFTGIVRDKIGRKMSKSLGNSPDPLDLIEKFGADGVRMGLMLGAPAGHDIMYD
ncbi:MAG: class I tRNA ligase family protein, partial [Bacteroidales bacterium]|nr:class I tRNA ligase family protein [Bacteroidales bacterium]